MNPETLKLIACLLVVSALIGTGWVCRGWQEDAEDLAQLGAAQQAIAMAEKRESEVARVVEARLATLNANQTVIEREKIKLVDRPVYNLECLDAAGLLLINQSKARDGTRKPENKVPGVAGS